MRRKTTMRKKARDAPISTGESTQDPTGSVKENENETQNSDIPTSSRYSRKKATSINESTLNGLESSSKTEETTSKKTDKQKDDALITKELQIILERCEEPEKNELEFAEMLKSSAENGEGKAKSAPKDTSKGTKRKKGNKSDDNIKPSKSAKKEKQLDNSKIASKREKIPDVTSIDFSNESKSSDGNAWNLKMSSWNVNGIRAWLEKNGLSFLHHEKPDILCVQETKCSDDKMPEEMKQVEDYHTYWLSGDKDGYSGVGLLSKEKPISVEFGIGTSEHDNEGRVITAEYEKFYLVAAYVPNAGRGLVRLEYRMKWDEDFRAYLKKLDAQKPVVLTGDLNVAHEEIDLANPKTNKKNAGFTKEEREGFSTLLGEGFIDAFRHLYPDVTGAYTFWTYMMNARAKNAGWRLDYFVLSERLCKALCDCVIRKDVLGSDHCPITLFLSL